MALQNFTDKVGPVISAAWLNVVDALKFTVFGDAATKAAARTALTSDAPFEIVNGGTGSRTGVTQFFSGVDSGTANTYVITSTPTPPALTTGVVRRFVAANANTGASTLNADGTGAIAVVGQTGLALTGGEILTTGPTWVQYTGSAWQIVGTGALPDRVRTAAEIAASVTPTNYLQLPLDLRRYGGDPTGAVASDTALANAIAVCGAAGGTITTGPGTYTFAAQINLNQKLSITIQGPGTATGGAAPATKFTYTGTGSGIWITMLSAVGCRFRGIQLTHNNAGFTGTYLKCGNDGTHGDPVYCTVEDGTMGNTLSATVHLDLDKNTTFACVNVNFINGSPSVKGAAPGSYSILHSFIRCEWHQCQVAPVQDVNQSWSFISCNWEPLANGNAGAMLSNSTSTVINGLTLMDCWIGDATGSGTWFDLAGQGITVIDGYYTATPAGSPTAIGFNLRHVHGFRAQGVTFANLLSAVNLGDSTLGQLSLKGCIVNNCTATSVTQPIAFTVGIGSGATSATLTVAWPGETGAFQVIFSDGESKSVTLTAGATTATWTGGLANNVTANANVTAAYNAPLGSMDCSGNFGFTAAVGHVLLNASGGYRVSDDGFLEQWADVSVTNGTPLAVTFPKAFPNSCFQIQLTMISAPATGLETYYTGKTTTGFNANVAGAAGTTVVSYRAVGK